MTPPSPKDRQERRKYYPRNKVKYCIWACNKCKTVLNEVTQMQVTAHLKTHKTPNPISKGEENPHIKHGDWTFIDRGKNKGMLRCACGEVITKPSKQCPHGVAISLSKMCELCHPELYKKPSQGKCYKGHKNIKDAKDCNVCLGYNHPEKQGTAEWSDEFDELFVCDDGTMNKYDGNDIKSFIRRLLSSQRQQILEEVEKMKQNKKPPYQALQFSDCPHCGTETNMEWVENKLKEVRNEALDEVRKALQK